MLGPRLSCSAKTEDTGNRGETRLERDTSKTGEMVIYRRVSKIIPENMSNMGVAEFFVSRPTAMYSMPTEQYV